IYTDVWTSMGQESEREQRRRQFAPFQVNAQLLAQAPPHARLMHCLPAVRGEEVSDEAIEGERSIGLQPAENQLHAEEALLLGRIRGDEAPNYRVTEESEEGTGCKK